MNEQQLNAALQAATSQNNAMGELVKFANGANFDCPDARAAAKLAGEVMISKGANEQAIVKTMGAAYEAVLFTAMHQAGRINPPNQQYANRIQEVYNQVVRMVNSTRQDQGRVEGQGAGGLFTKSQGGSMFDSAPTSQGTLFGAKESTSQGGLFGKKEEPLFASSKQEEPSSNLFGSAAVEEEATVDVTQPPQKNQFRGNPSMESLIAHETETKLRSTCVTARQVSDSIAVYKEAIFNEDMLGEFNSNTAEIIVNPSKRTPIHIAVLNNVRGFEIGESEVTEKVVDALREDVVKYNNEIERLRTADFSARMVSGLLTAAVSLHVAFEAFASSSRENPDLETLTVTDSTRAATAVTAELYRALTMAIGFVSEDKGMANSEGTGYVNFELDYSDFKEEAEQLEEFFHSYEGKQASMFEMLFCQLARALNWIRVGIEDDTAVIGRREIRVELPYPLLDNVDVMPHHQLLDRDAMGENLNILTDLCDLIEKRLPDARIQIIDGLYRVGYVDRAYSTGRPKIALN